MTLRAELATIALSSSGRRVGRVIDGTAPPTLVRDVDAAVDALGSDSHSVRVGALLACGRIQDAYKVAAAHAQDSTLVQQVLAQCRQPPLDKMKSSAAIVEMCTQYLSFARGGRGSS